MASPHPIFLSAPYAKNLSPDQDRFVRAVRALCEREGLGPVELDDANRLADNAHAIRNLHGVLVLALAQWSGQRVGRKKDDATFPSEFAHLHAATAVAADKPLFVVRERSVSERGVLKPGLGCRTVRTPADLDPDWLAGADFRRHFDLWLAEVKAQHDIFLGYCSKNAGLAAQIQLRLERAGARVRNWAMDFRSGSSILEEIEAARMQCSAGVFLFAENDPLAGAAGAAAPRDNVVFEAGYFMAAKGPRRCLVVREGEAKMPADLGGAIYLQLDRSGGIASIEARLAEFVEATLGRRG